MNQQVATYDTYQRADDQELVIAYHEIEQCVVKLGIAVGRELLKAEALMAGRDSQPESEA